MALDPDQCLCISFKEQFFQISWDFFGIFPRATWHFREFIFIQVTLRSQFSYFTWKKLGKGQEGTKSTVWIHQGVSRPFFGRCPSDLMSQARQAAAHHPFPFLPFLSVFPEEQSTGWLQRGIFFWGLGTWHVQRGAGGSLPATGRAQVGWTQHLSVLSACRQNAHVRGTGLVWRSWTTSAAPWAPYFSRAASHAFLQLASGAKFFRSAECLRLEWS